MQPFSERLANLSERAKDAEQALNAAANEARERIDQRREQFRTAATEAANRVQEDLSKAGPEAQAQWTALKAKVTADISRLKANITERQVERNVTRLADRAARKETEAYVAIDFALASIEDAKLAVLDAVIAEKDARSASVET